MSRVKMNFHSADMLLGEAEKNIESNNIEQALVCAQKSLETYPSLKSAFFLQVLFMKLNQYDSSIEIAKKGIGMLENADDLIRDSYLYKIYLQLSMAYRLKGDLENSKSTLKDLLPQITSRQQIESVKKMIQNIESTQNWTEDYKFFKDFLNTYRMKEEDIFYVVDANWFEEWENFNTGKNKKPPGPISNLEIIKPLRKENVLQIIDEPYTHTILKSDLTENQDYFLLPEKVFLMLKEKHSPVDYEIKRYCVAVNEESNDLQVEVTLRKLKLFAIPSLQKSFEKTLYVSNKKLISDLKQNLIQILTPVLENTNLSSNDLKLWKVPERTNLTLIDERQKKIIITEASLLQDSLTIEENELNPDEKIVIEFIKKDGTWSITNKASEMCANCHKTGVLMACSKCKTIKYCNLQCQQSHHRFHKPNCKPFQAQEIKPKGRCGIVGLQNLGNTCFMNSALQCLSNTLPLTGYFLQGNYREDLNYNNPLGTKGAALALAYAELLHEMWEGTSSVVSPWNFKKVLSKFASQFSGYQQHDSHELLSYLLTGLHEDLNRVKTKKYIEMPDVTDKPEKEAADIQWGLFLERNQSAIVDLMYGQNKSTLVCPDCGKVSITFDPFLSLSLAVPSTDSVSLNVFVLFLDDSKSIIKFKINLEPRATIKKLKDFLTERYSARFLAYLQEKFIFKQFCDDSVVVDSLKESFIFFTEIPENFDKYVPIPINFSKIGEKGHPSSKVTITFPRILFMKKTQTYKDFMLMVAKKCQKVYKDSGVDVPESLADFESNSLFKINIIKKMRSTCNFCRTKCDGCEFLLDCDTDFAEILELHGKVFEPLTLEIGFVNKAKGIDFLNKYTEEKSVSIAEKTKLDINYCMKISSMPEKLDENNKWFCSQCKDHVCASKQLKVYKLPDILIVHLLRFKKKGLWTEKITTAIDFPVENFAMSSISEENVLYDLFAVSNHFGGTGGGHYTAYIKNPTVPNWLEMDDSRVNSISASQVVSSSAYILFYKRKSNKYE